MVKPTTRLNQKCTNRDCSKVFCRQIEDVCIEKEVLGILAKYKDSLSCKKIMKKSFTTETQNNYFLIDSMVYVCNLICNSQDIRTGPSSFNLKNSKILSEIKISETKNNSLLEPIKHCYCSLMSKQINDVEKYFMIGIINFLLKKFLVFSDLNLALIILRYFTILGDQGSIDKDLFGSLLKVFETVSNKVANSVTSSFLPDHKNCIKGQCLFFFNLSKKDFEKSVKIIKKLIEKTIFINFREDQRIVRLFKIFEKLHEINLKMNVCNEKKFLLNIFYSRLNLKSELKFFKLKFDSPITYFFTIPLQIKAELLRIQNSDLMKTTLQEAFFKALFEGVTQPYLFISIRRDKIYQDTLSVISKIEECDIRKQLKVKFKGEDGIDSGGIKKEFFLLLGHEIENDISLFTQTNNRIWFKSGADLEMIEGIGKLVGIALYNDVVLNVPFPSMLFKKLLGISVLYEDLEEIEPEIYNSLKKLESCTSDELLFLDQNFTVDIEINGKRTNCELFPNGRNVKVTKDNLDKFSLLYFRFLTDDAVHNEFEAFSRGFNSIVNRGFLQGLTSRELEKVIIGCDEIDFDVIRKNTIYNGYSADNLTIENFWSYFADLKPQKKKKLIQFITGNDRLPVGGSDSFALVIMKNGCDTDRLPSSQTCFNTLLLPEYSTSEKLKEKMNRAIDMTAGFFLM